MQKVLLAVLFINDKILDLNKTFMLAGATDASFMLCYLYFGSTAGLASLAFVTAVGPAFTFNTAPCWVSFPRAEAGISQDGLHCL